MTFEHDTEQHVMNYLMMLGFSRSAIRSDVRTTYGEAVDLGIYGEAGLQAVVETKRHLAISERDSGDFRFDPVVRKLQLKAKEIGLHTIC